MYQPKTLSGAAFLLLLFFFLLPSDKLCAQSCGVPVNLRVSSLTQTTGLLSWNSVTGATSYVVRFRPVGSTSWLRQNSTNNTEVISGLIPNTLYEAKVRSTCGSAESAYCTLYQFSTLSNASAACSQANVIYFSSTNITANSCLVSWRRISGVTSYNVQHRIRYSNVAWTPSGSTTQGSLQINGLLPSTQYEFQVQTVCPTGNATYSPSGIFTTQAATCGIPSNLNISNITENSVRMSWSGLNCARYYVVNYRKTNLTWVTDTTASTSINLTGLSSGTGYEFRIRSVANSGSNSGFSSLFLFSTPSPGCGSVSGLTAGNVGTGSANLLWNPVAGATSYFVRHRLAGSQSWISSITSGTILVVNGLSPDNAYEFQVQPVCGTSNGSFSHTAVFVTQANPANNLPVPDHIVICILENKAYTQLMNSSLTPFINSLANSPKTAVFKESYGITHPSQPNYIHLFSGTNQGVTGNSLPSQKFTTPNLARELFNAGRTFATYSEGLPSVGYDGESSGRYRRRHNPVTNWMGTGVNQVPPTVNQPFTSFPTSNFASLPTVSIVVPDMDNGMHDGTLGTAIARGDAWLANNMNAYIQWAKSNNSLFILTTDEDDGAHDNRILTLFSGQMVSSGYFLQGINHHHVLRTIAEMYGLAFIGNSANVNAIRGCWTNGFRMRDEETTVARAAPDHSGWRVYPNPAYDEVHASFELKDAADVTIKILSSTGSLVHEDKLGLKEKGTHVYDVPLETRRYPAGIYFMEIRYGTEKFVQRFLISQ